MYRGRQGQFAGHSETAGIMNVRRVLKRIHVASTLWFMVCVGYVLAMALRQAGIRWWVIFSFSGHSAVVVLLLVSLYLFAIFRGSQKDQKIEIEHALSSSSYYMAFYVSAPTLGGLAGVLAAIGEQRVGQFVLAVALGTLAGTFLTWVIVDPVVSLFEMLMPASRVHRAERLATAKSMREKKQRDKERLLANILAEEQRQEHHWRDVFRPQAERLAVLLGADIGEFGQAEREAADIGVSAWRAGGLGCMRQLREMAIDIYKSRREGIGATDYITMWWDGIGSWRSRSLT